MNFICEHRERIGPIIELGTLKSFSEDYIPTVQEVAMLIQRGIIHTLEHTPIQRLNTLELAELDKIIRLRNLYKS